MVFPVEEGLREDMKAKLIESIIACPGNRKFEEDLDN